MNQFTDFPDLICQGNGGQILFATDDFFAVCENMILDSEPIWNPTTYTPEGKEMDGKNLLDRLRFDLLSLWLAGYPERDAGLLPFSSTIYNQYSYIDHLRHYQLSYRQ